MSIFKKLLEVQKKIIGLSKDKKSFGYDYVTANKLLEYLKPIMNEQGLLLKQEMLKIERERINYKSKNGEKSEILYMIDFKFTWVDVETGERDENLFSASGMNDWEKGIGSAASYAERYFLLKYFHIATDEDDIDNPDRKQEEKEHLKKGEENQNYQPKQEAKPFNKALAIKSIMEIIKGDAALLNKQLDYYKIKNLDVATEIQLKSIYKYLSPKK